MSKNGKKNPRYIINWETHAKNLLKNFCSLMEHQSLVDIVICCGNNTIQAHKFVLAANSPLFREEFEKNPSIEQIMIGGCDFTVLKSVIEIMYCGQTLVNEDNVKFLVAVVKLFQMKHLENLFTEHASSNEDIYLPKPQFLTKKPKYPAFTYQLPPVVPQSSSITTNSTTPVTAPKISVPPNLLKPTDFNISVPESFGGFKSYQRGKRTLKQQAEQACVKEAQASRMALASLQKEIAAAPQVSSFIIEDTCAETTVENFIPHPEPAPYVQTLNYNDVMSDNLENAMFLPIPVPQNSNPGTFNINNDRNQTEKRSLTAEKLKYILGSHLPTNVEVMYKDADGNFVPVNEEVLQNLANKEGLQYQVVDEDGRVSEMQELQVIDKIDKLIDNMTQNAKSEVDLIEITKPPIEVSDFLNDSESSLTIKDHMCSMISLTGQETQIPTRDMVKLNTEVDLKFSPDIFFSDIISQSSHDDVTVVEDDIFETPSKTEKP